ncbi:MAG: pyruvate dehydrogenase (acetyl-transferring) E1 component subunit alpha [Betaproteobacteria bacterium]|nr:pyruvate dehydrogenase (acetyl-transferring) E1 component subunit alpha [Betaproteobacteria bacterium]
MNSVLARFEIEHVRFLDAQGEVVAQPLPEFTREAEALIALYRAMALTRAFDAKAIALQRIGKIGTFASSLGQEAVAVGAASALRTEDVLLPSYRDHGAQLVRGVTMTEILLTWSGDERGNDYAVARHDFPNCIPIASQVGHAAGVAYAMKLRREARVALCLFGDGATSKGDFYEAMNIAGAWGLPLVMVINNNQWAISVPRSAQSAAQTLAQKAIAAGIEGRQVDGNDVIAVHAVTREAADKARRGGGPTLVEALSYRLGDHTTADDASRYRDAAALQEQWRLEPLARLRAYLARIGAWDKEREEQLARECAEQVAAAVQAFLAIAPPGTEEMFDHLYAALPAALREQREAALRRGRSGRHG